MTMDKDRYKHLKFLDAVFPDMPLELIVKVKDKRFKEGWYLGIIEGVFRSDYPFKIYKIRHLVFYERSYWVFRDHIEVPERGNKKDLIKECLI